MKMQFKALVLATTLSLIAGSSFAAQDDLSSLTDVSTALPFAAFTDAQDAVAALVASGGGLDVAIDLADNVAVIVQNGVTDVNYAFIDQSGGVNNSAVILQDSTAQASSAAIIQFGTGNRAIVNQH